MIIPAQSKRGLSFLFVNGVGRIMYIDTEGLFLDYLVLVEPFQEVELLAIGISGRVY